MAGIETQLGAGSQSLIRLNFGDSQCDVHAWGATLTSWMVNGKEQLYLSTTAVFDGKRAIRGGIPIVFPQFSQPHLYMPQHGFARTNQWTYLGSCVDEECCSAYFSLQENESTMALWPKRFLLVYEVKLGLSSLDTNLSIFNVNDEPFEFQSLLHTYIRVDNIGETTIEGLGGLQFKDKLKNNAEFSENTNELNISSEIDRIYLRQNVVESLAVVKKGNTAITLCSSSTMFAFKAEIVSAIQESSSERLQKLLGMNEENEGKSDVDMVLWNAWEEKSKALADLDDLAYLNYLCLEPGLVSKWNLLQPGNGMTLKQSLSLMSNVAF